MRASRARITSPRTLLCVVVLVEVFLVSLAAHSAHAETSFGASLVAFSSPIAMARSTIAPIMAMLYPPRWFRGGASDLRVFLERYDLSDEYEKLRSAGYETTSDVALATAEDLGAEAMIANAAVRRRMVAKAKELVAFRFWKSPWFLIPLIIGSVQLIAVTGVVAVALMYPSSRQSLFEITITISLLSWFALRRLQELVAGSPRRRREGVSGDDGEAAELTRNGCVGGDVASMRQMSAANDATCRDDEQKKMPSDDAEPRNDIFACFGLLGTRQRVQKKKKKKKN